MFELNKLNREWAVGILKRQMTYFGEKFNKQWASVTDGGTNLEPLIESMQEVFEGLNEVEISRGLTTMRTKTFVPSLPEFRSWCLEGSSQFLDVDTAYINAANEKYTDAATYEAARRTGFYEVRTRAESSAKPVFKKHYEAVCAQLEINPHAFRLPESKQIEQAPPQFVRKDSSFFEQMKRGIA